MKLRVKVGEVGVELSGNLINDHFIAIFPDETIKIYLNYVKNIYIEIGKNRTIDYSHSLLEEQSETEAEFDYNKSYVIYKTDNVHVLDYDESLQMDANASRIIDDIQKSFDDKKLLSLLLSK